ncbi:MAG: hypothetical protein A2163_01075 [Actinobacteria bacterium RBG_13_35_12]|uniref:DUF3307 domain-containing protein n=1 Tax=Candidatus Sediminicultor quintus TaxID=1797291 RepID=A0A1F5ABM9_9BACT|nr:MAG: hypothetical protein A2163_01075 [Actinobacteria bacterium RBG_13_35_12]OGD15941.1 MAG: hypothetical protein A2V47_04185 [Candidatus Atribacteria bacterium RBG_19FT_COMBO_35_14]
MFLFYRLLLAHIIADFPLQTKQIFKVKMNTEWGVLIHTLIVLIFSILFAFPYLEAPKFIVILWAIFLTHTMIDKLKMEYSKKNANPDIKIFFLDQFLHISIITALSFNFDKIYLLISPFNNAFLNYLIHLYNNDIFIISLIGYIAAAFFIPILLMYIREEGIPANPKKLKEQKILNIIIPENQTLDKFYRLFLTLSAQYLDDKYIIVIFICFVIISFVPYQRSAERMEKVYNLKRIMNSSLAIFIGIILKMI